MTPRIKIKFLARTPADQDPALWLSLFPGPNPEIGECQFCFDLDEKDYDFLVVYEGLTFLQGEQKSNRIEALPCGRNNSLFITTEPYSIKIYGPQFLAQFGHVLSAQPRHIIKHRRQIFETPPLRWYYGRPLSPEDDAYTDIDSFQTTQPLSKQKNLSAVVSDKQMNPALKLRYDFVAGLKDRLGDKFDWFGRGIRPISDKAEAMDDFRYHIAIENHVANDHWTEKITDCFLAFNLPFYYGAPNLDQYFPPESFVPIDITDIDRSADIIESAIANDLYAQRLPAIIEARSRTLTNFNLMNTIARIVPQIIEPEFSKDDALIMGRHAFRKQHPIQAARDLIHRVRHKNG